MSDLPLPEMKCDTPGCDCKEALVLHARCHPHDPLWPRLYGDMMVLICSICDEFVGAYRLSGVVSYQDAKREAAGKAN